MSKYTGYGRGFITRDLALQMSANRADRLPPEKATLVETVMEDYDSESFPTTAIGFIKYLQDIVDSIPEQHRENSKFELEFGDYGHMRITYHRPETDEEHAQRVRDWEADQIRAEKAEREKAKREKAERAQLRRLKEKYEK